MPPVLCPRRLRAAGLGGYPRASAASMTRWRLAWSTTAVWLRTRETVEIETRARWATSRIVEAIERGQAR